MIFEATIYRDCRPIVVRFYAERDRGDPGSAWSPRVEPFWWTEDYRGEDGEQLELTEAEIEAIEMELDYG